MAGLAAGTAGAGAQVNVTFVNAALSTRTATTLTVREDSIAAVGSAPAAGDLVIDLQGDRLLPGLINAHDHLQLNNFPRIRFRDRHANVSEWIADLDARRNSEHALVEAHAIARDVRLWVGGLKNLLAGVTTVAHHDPLFAQLRAPEFPVRVLQDYAWAHSLGIDGDEVVRRSHREANSQQPWFVHAGEGVDELAGGEFARLESLGCLTANTLLIHGVAFSPAELCRLAGARAALIWCPASNLFLFGRTADVTGLAVQGRVALGSDSRLSGSVDLLAELRMAHATGLVAEHLLETLVTSASAQLLRLPDRGALTVGALADFLILPRDMPLWSATRADVRCVISGGMMVYGDAEYAERLPPVGALAAVVVDGREKRLARPFASFLERNPSHEPGVQLLCARERAA